MVWNHATVCFSRTFTLVDTLWARKRYLMYVESVLRTLHRIPLELRLLCVASFSGDTFVQLPTITFTWSWPQTLEWMNLTIWFVKVFVGTEVVECHQHPARLPLVTIWNSISLGWVLCNSVIGCATFGLHKFLQQLFFCQLLDGSIRLRMQTLECQSLL